MSKRKHQLVAMKAIFDLDTAIASGKLSVNDLSEILTKSVEAGWDHLAIIIAMVSMAVRIAAEGAKAAGKPD